MGLEVSFRDELHKEFLFSNERGGGMRAWLAGLLMSFVDWG